MFRELAISDITSNLIPGWKFTSPEELYRFLVATQKTLIDSMTEYDEIVEVDLTELMDWADCNWNKVA